MSKGPAEPFKKLLPQSWLGWIAAAVITVVAVTHPGESWHATSRTIWGAGRWAGYEAFAACGTPPPYTWMSQKRCPDTASVAPDPAETGTPAATSPSGRQSRADRVAIEAVHLHRVIDATLTEDGAKPSQQQGTKR